jgi:hypothetical protein
MSTDIFSHKELPPAVVSQNTRAWRRYLWVVPAAVAAATLANVVFYFVLTKWIGEPLLMGNELPPPLLTPMEVWEVILFSIIFSLAASFVYLFLSLLTQRPDRNFIIISAVILLVSFVPLLGVPDSPVAMSARLSLVTMHIIGAIVVVGLLVGLGRSRV